MSYIKDFVPEFSVALKERREEKVEAEAVLPDYMPPVMRIIRTEAVPFLRSKQTYGEKTVIDGNVEFRVFYLSENNKTNSFFYKAPFSHTEETDEGASLDFSAETKFKEIRALSPQKLSLRAAVSVFATEKKETLSEIISSDGEEDDVAVLKAEETFTRRTKNTETAARQEGEISLNGKPFDKIISYAVRFLPPETKPTGKKTLIKTDAVLEILYSVPDERRPKKISEKTVVSAVSDFEIYDGETVFCVPFLSDCRLELSENADGLPEKIEYTLDVLFTAATYREDTVPTVKDAFGTKTEVVAEKKNTSFGKAIFRNDTVSFENAIDIGDFSEIFDVSATALIKNTRFDKSENKAVCDGEFVYTLLYSDGGGDLFSKEKKVPFSLENDLEKGFDDVFQSLFVSVSDVGFEKSDGKVLIKTDLSVYGEVFAVKNVSVISEISKTENETKKDKNSLVLYYAKKGEKIWDIAKKYKTPPENISKKNDLSENVLSENKMLMII